MGTCKDPSILVKIADVDASDGRLCVVAVHRRRFLVTCSVLAPQSLPQRGQSAHPRAQSSAFHVRRRDDDQQFLPLSTRSTSTRTRRVHLPRRGCNCLPHDAGCPSILEGEKRVHLLPRSVDVIGVRLLPHRCICSRPFPDCRIVTEVGRGCICSFGV